MKFPPLPDKHWVSGTYVLATKYCDGDPGDHYCVGAYDGCYDHYGDTRFLVRDNEGKPFRANGFRRCESITDSEGKWLIEHFPDFKPFEVGEDEEGNDVMIGWSVWDWLSYHRGQLGPALQHDGDSRLPGQANAD